MEIRLQKILAEMGIASRRVADALIADGRVTVNGKIAEPGTKADPEVDHIKLDGKLLTGRPEPKVYLLFHKPKDVMTTMDDPEGRATVADFLGRVKARVYPVGRLDYDSEGLLVLTNDGDLAYAIMHPSKKFPKTYHVKVKGVIEDPTLEKLAKGVYIEGGKTAPAEFRKLKKLDQNSWIEVVLYEGKKRQIRRMLQSVGYTVIRLIRVKVGPLELTGIKPGEHRKMTEQEFTRLMSLVGKRAHNRARKA